MKRQNPNVNEYTAQWDMEDMNLDLTAFLVLDRAIEQDLSVFGSKAQDPDFAPIYQAYRNTVNL